MIITYQEDLDVLDIWFGDEIIPVFYTTDSPTNNELLYYDEKNRLLGLTVEEASRKVDLEALRRSPHFQTREEPVRLP